MSEYGVTCPEIINYEYSYIFNKISHFVHEYDVNKIKEIVGQNFGINPFDLFILEKYIEENKIKSIIEFGCGSSSKFLDGIGVNRTSFANESIFYNVDFKALNILESYSIIQDFINNNEFDMFLIDSDHTSQMAQLISEKFLNLVNNKKSVFIHDWFDNKKITYTEQVFYLENIIKFYDVEYMTDLPEEYVNKLINMNDQINIVTTNIPRCSVILKPNERRIHANMVI